MRALDLIQLSINITHAREKIEGRSHCRFPIAKCRLAVFVNSQLAIGNRQLAMDGGLTPSVSLHSIPCNIQQSGLGNYFGVVAKFCGAFAPGRSDSWEDQLLSFRGGKAAVTSQDKSGSAMQNGTAVAEANAHRRRLADYRTMMLANITHELRTPLTAILGFAEILLDFEKLTESQRDFCEKIQSSGRQLQSTINLLADLTNLRPDGVESVVHEFSPGDALRESCAAVSRRAEKKNVVLVCNIDDAIGSGVSDESQVRQVLFNLLAYAIARSPVGGQVTSTAIVAANSDVLFRIDDEGEPVDLSRGLEFAGVGSGGEDPNLHQLGLEISRRLLQVLGGTVTLENREPQGLSIAVKLPARASLL